MQAAKRQPRRLRCSRGVRLAALSLFPGFLFYLLVRFTKQRFLRLIETVTESRFFGADHAVGVAVAVNAYVGILAGSKMLAGTETVAVFVHAEVADAWTGVRNIVLAGFRVLIRAAIETNVVVI